MDIIFGLFVVAVLFSGFAWWGLPLGIILWALAFGLLSGVCLPIYKLNQNRFFKFFIPLWIYYAFIPFLPWVLPSSFVENQKLLSVLASLKWNWLYAVACLLIGYSAAVTMGAITMIFTTPYVKDRSIPNLGTVWSIINYPIVLAMMSAGFLWLGVPWAVVAGAVGVGVPMAIVHLRIRNTQGYLAFFYAVGIGVYFGWKVAILSWILCWFSSLTWGCVGDSLRLWHTYGRGGGDMDVSDDEIPYPLDMPPDMGRLEEDNP